MIKGPITPALVCLTLIAVGAWEREWRWMRRLLSLPGIAAAILIDFTLELLDLAGH